MFIAYLTKSHLVIECQIKIPSVCREENRLFFTVVISWPEYFLGIFVIHRYIKGGGAFPHQTAATANESAGRGRSEPCHGRSLPLCSRGINLFAHNYDAFQTVANAASNQSSCSFPHCI